MTHCKRQVSAEVHSLLLKFVKLGDQAKQFRGHSNPIAVATYRTIREQSRSVMTEASRLSATLDKNDENRQLFLVSLILAAAATDNSDFERELMDLLDQIMPTHDLEQIEP